jgi:signal transduction histidine kinase
MTTMAQRLDAVLADQRRFVADASHQLRTPLTALRLRLENLQSDLEAGGGDPDGRAVDALERAIGETERLTELVSNLLQLARADSRPVIEFVDLVALVGDRVDTWTAIADERGVELRHVPPGAPVPVRCVAGAIEQILDNLLDNALAVSPAGERIDVEIDTDVEPTHDGFVQLRVVDHGPGLDDAAKADAMRRFWRGDATRPGTGLGLAIVETLATSSGGRAALVDTVGGGLTVIVELPAGE